jgi:hypothetical protein
VQLIGGQPEAPQDAEKLDVVAGVGEARALRAMGQFADDALE